MIHTTIGVYSDGSFKVNGVKSEDLINHIDYNKTFRFGRALIIDGKIEYQGYLSKEDLEKIIKEKNLANIKITSCTAPYQ